MNLKLACLMGLLFCLVSLDLFAQYTGGKGDGYARASASVTITAVEAHLTAAAWQLMPNRCLKGQPVLLEGPLEKQPIQYCIYNVAGQLVQPKTALNDPRIATNDLSSGWYQLVLFVEDQQINKTLIVME